MTADLISHVLICAPSTEYIHHQTFFDTALPIAYSLRQLGHPAEVTTDASACTGRTLVFGANLIPQFGGTIEAGDYIIFNLEQYSSPWMTEAYLDILKRYEVWDYSLKNIEFLKGNGVEAKYCPIGYHPCMSNIRLGKSPALVGGGTALTRVDYAPWPTVSLPVGIFDVLFYGSMNDRRRKIMGDLRKVGLNVINIVGYGAYRDKYVSRAKIVLNMNYYENGLFNITRVAPLLANEKCVVSELGSNAEEFLPYANGVSFCEYDDLVVTCIALLENEKLRLERAKIGFHFFKALPQVDILKGIL